MFYIMKKWIVFGLITGLLVSSGFCAEQDIHLQREASEGLRKASEFYYGRVASLGGYVYHYSLDLKQRWGEGPATHDQVWVEPPGTPTVGMAFLKAFEATGESFYLKAAQEAAEALVYGQLKSGGWTNLIDFDPKGRVSQYRNGKGGGKNNSSFDDGQSQSAVQLLMNVDKALGFQNQKIHEAASYALDSILAAQFANGGFPQVWTGPVDRQPVLKAKYPAYDWRTEGRIKNYWDMYTLNDNVCGYLVETLNDAWRIYEDRRYLVALKRLGNFLLLAQMPEPQPGWCQQYNYAMVPIWARKFEPAAIASDETQEVILTLMRIYSITKDPKYLKPIPPALVCLKRSLLPDGQLARFYELKTNRPLYMRREGKSYFLTYDDAGLPGHYAWKISSKLDEIKAEYTALRRDASAMDKKPDYDELAGKVRGILKAMDEQGRWVSIYEGKKLQGQAKFKLNEPYLSSAVFCENVELLSEYLLRSKTESINR